MTNNEKFCALINSCENPQLMLDTLMALAPMFRAMNERRRAAAATEQPAEEAAKIMAALPLVLPNIPASAPAEQEEGKAMNDNREEATA